VLYLDDPEVFLENYQAGTSGNKLPVLIGHPANRTMNETEQALFDASNLRDS